MSERPEPGTRRWRPRLAIAGLLVATVALGAAVQRRPSEGDATVEISRHSADGALAIHGRLDRAAVLAGGDGIVRLELLLESTRPGGQTAAQLPTDLVVVLDRSGSMQGEKLQQAKAAVHHLVSRLGPDDRFALVTFASETRLEIPLAAATDATRRAWRERVERIHAGGGTFMVPGLTTGLGTLEAGRLPGRSARAILISDGLAAEPPELLKEQAARAARSEAPLSTVGVGADFDELLLGALADTGTGNYYYLERADALARIFEAEFETARETVASGVTVTIEPAAGVAVVDAAGYPLDRSASGVRFRPGTLFAGQQRRVWVTLRLPAEPGREQDVGVVHVDYDDARGERGRVTLAGLPQVATVAESDRFFAGIDPGAWADAVVVEEYNQLRQSVAALVREGNRERALEQIGRFHQQLQATNRAVGSPAVAAQLEVAESLKDEVSDAFRGPDAENKQKRLGKELHAEGTRARRAGSRK